MGLFCLLVFLLPWEKKIRSVYVTKSTMWLVVLISCSVFMNPVFRYRYIKLTSSLTYHQILLFLAQLEHGANYWDQRFSRSFGQHLKNCNMTFLGILSWQTLSLFLDFFPTFQLTKNQTEVICKYHKHLLQILDPTYKAQVAEFMKLFRSLLLGCCLIRTQLLTFYFRPWALWLVLAAKWNWLHSLEETKSNKCT